MKIIFLWLLCILGLSSCMYSRRNECIIDAEKLKIGDTVCGFKVSNIRYIKDTYGTEISLGLEGELIVEGDYMVLPLDDPFFPGIVRYKPDDYKRIPFLNVYNKKYDYQLNFDDERTRNRFGNPGDEGRAKIKIDQIQLYYLPKEILNGFHISEIIDISEE